MAALSGSGRPSSTVNAPTNAVTVGVHMRFGDIDTYGHLNNVAMLAILEEARIQLLWRTDEGTSARSTAVVDAGPHGTTAMLVASQRIDYLKPILYRTRPLAIDMWVGKLGAATLQLNYLIRDTKPVLTTYVRAETLLVCAHRHTNTPRRLTAEEREAWKPLIAERIQFLDR